MQIRQMFPFPRLAQALLCAAIGLCSMAQAAAPLPPAVIDPFAPPEGVPADVDRAVRIASLVHKIDAALIHAVIQQESRYNRKAVSPRGAQGLMQLMPDTAKRLGVGNAFDTISNVNGGTKYLRILMEQFKNDLKLVLAAYNAGEGAVIAAGYKVPPYAETQAYVPGVLGNYERLKTAMGRGQPVTMVAAPPPAVEAAPAAPAPIAQNKTALVDYVEVPTQLLVPATVIDAVYGAAATGSTIDQASVAVIDAPSAGGHAEAMPNGVIAYRPARGFRGTEVFTYAVRDLRGTLSNPATVTVTVR
jgi:Transglycosylase SLT domain/Bacterial Ig domain